VHVECTLTAIVLHLLCRTMNLRHETSVTVEGRPSNLVPAKPFQIATTDVPRRDRESFVLAARPGLYTLLVLAVALITGAYSLRKYGIFSCQASGYGSDGYLGYCGATSYGDYDHGAMWFGLEPAASASAANAQTLFVGNSRTQFAFSSKATTDWFSSVSESYFLLGFSHLENYTFETPLLRKLRPRAKVYVINIDSFFDRSETLPGKTVMRDESSRGRYQEKRQWQGLHKTICSTFKAVCGHDIAIFRSRSTGAWLMTGTGFTSEPVSYDDHIDHDKLASYTALGKQFLPSLPVDRACTILTIVPTVKTDIGTAKAIATALGLKLVAPRLDGLMTFDKSHLDRESAQRWSAAFFEDAGPQIRQCLVEQTEPHVAMSGARTPTH
jgi:hypothetical protein